MKASVEVAFVEASVQVAFVEASVKAFMDASVEAFMKASVEAFMEASTAWKRGSFHASMKASIGSMEASTEAFTSFHQKCR